MFIEGTNVKIGQLVRMAGTWNGDRPFFIVQKGQLFSRHKQEGDLVTIPEFLVKIIQDFGTQKAASMASTKSVTLQKN